MLRNDKVFFIIQFVDIYLENTQILPLKVVFQYNSFSSYSHLRLECPKHPTGGFSSLHLFQLQWSSQKQALGHSILSQPIVPKGQPFIGRSIAISNIVKVRTYSHLQISYDTSI